MVWLISQVKAMARDNIQPLFVTRPVPLTEAMDALSRPALPGEIRWLPVSRLHNEPNLDLMSPSQNLWFRAVHDLTHWKANADDTFEGELTVANAHLATAPESIHWILWSEVACQAAVSIDSGEFPEQKLANVPIT